MSSYFLRSLLWRDLWNEIAYTFSDFDYKSLFQLQDVIYIGEKKGFWIDFDILSDVEVSLNSMRFLGYVV